MPTNYSGRVTLILIALFAALWGIFPGALKGRFKAALKPGIDIAGGASLLYEIRVPEDGVYSDQLATDVAGSLKKRVDPDGVRNLIWRPQGATRLEIQMPLSATSGESSAKRAAFAEAQRALEAMNVRIGAVIDAVERRSGDDRRQRLEQLAMGSETRERLFGGMASLFDQIKLARENKDAAAQAQKELEYEELKKQVEATNLPASALETTLGLKKETREKRLAELRERFAKFPRRLEAIERFVKVFDEFATVKDSLDDAAGLKRLLQGSGILEFYILVEPGEVSADQLTTMYQRLERDNGRPAAGDQMRWFEVDKGGEKLGGIQREHNEKTWVLAWTTPDKSMVKREGDAPWGLESAYPMRDQFGTQMVGFKFDAQGGSNFGNLTSANVGRHLAIMLDDKVISAPNINEPIRGGSGQISGNFTSAELKYLISTLSAGSLPARLADEPISERTIGPQLGEDNLRAGLIACMFGLVVVAVFLIGYYYLSGVVAMVAVLMNMVLILGVMAMLNATFTLAGVAGIVLTIGMAVDANVLIFERLREEQQRGLSLRMALRNAYDRAFSAILDGNVTTGITSLCLYLFGSEEVKGFGLTLLIGIVSSLFTALFVTRTIFGMLIDKFNIQRLGSLPLTFPKWDAMLRPKIDWVSKAWIFYTFSGVFITIGLIAFGAKMAQGQMLDIEFASGTSVQFELKQPMKIEQVRRLVNDVSRTREKDLPSPSVVSVGTDGLTYEIVTPSNNANGVKQAILAALGERLKLELASKFTGVGQPLDAVIGSSVVPIRSASDTFGGITSEAVGNHVGGAAIILDNLDPPISPADIEARIERQRLQPQPGQTTPPYRDFDVISDSNDPKAPVTKALVVVSDPAYPFEKDEQKWRDELAGPMWRLVGDAVNTDAQLSRVTNFDAQVAGETQREAVIALTLSIIGIMAYIWIRFGNLKYGTATVVALAHDTLFVLAAVGLAHYVANTVFGDALLIEPFRLNLTLTAAILTVMGYSMNDTVVVFDRIRENRGKFGHVSRQVINDSINQTLSRTLLTGGTTILTIFVMYIFGGPGIHGFTFALLVGILVGTYSSIAIASPILLIGIPPGEKGVARRGADVRATPAGQRLQRV